MRVRSTFGILEDTWLTMTGSDTARHAKGNAQRHNRPPRCGSQASAVESLAGATFIGRSYARFAAAEGERRSSDSNKQTPKSTRFFALAVGNLDLAPTSVADMIDGANFRPAPAAAEKSSHAANPRNPCGGALPAFARARYALPRAVCIRRQHAAAHARLAGSNMHNAVNVANWTFASGAWSGR
jgi:hypothetical protein